nr:uncharacterized protein LOC127342915 [Lolium perenne]
MEPDGDGRGRGRRSCHRRVHFSNSFLHLGSSHRCELRAERAVDGGGPLNSGKPAVDDVTVPGPFVCRVEAVAVTMVLSTSSRAYDSLHQFGRVKVVELLFD